MSSKPKGPSARLVIGIAITALGVLLLLDSAGLLEADRVLRFWPLVLVALGLVMVRRGFQGGNWFPGAAVLIVGLILVAQRLGFAQLDFDKLWPLFIILVGLGILTRAFRGGRTARSPGRTSDNRLSKVAVLCGLKPSIGAEAFEGGDLTTWLGGVDLDLTGADIAEGGADLDLFVLMGGVEIKVPRDWSVDSRVTPFMGGMEDSTDQTDADPDKQLRISGFVMMGGVEVKN